MKKRFAMRLLLPCVILVHGVATRAQESVGFTDPQDVDALLEYRLPDWGYRTWDATFDFAGSGRERTVGADRQVGNRNRVGLGSNLHWRLDGERRDRGLRLDVVGDFSHDHVGFRHGESRRRSLDGDVSLGTHWDEYLGAGPLMVGAAAGINWSHDEDRIDERTDVRRDRSVTVGPRIGFGRVRDVTPHVRASRLSERLIALGRSGLTDAQVREVAEILAREQGYRTIFERPDRSFWRDVLEPMLDPARPLTPYEILYLRDVLSEDVGHRAQGTAIVLSGSYSESVHEVPTGDSRSVYRWLRLGASIYRNLSLHHQLRGEASVSVHDRRYALDVVEETSPGLSLEHLWSLADRYLLTTSLDGLFTYAEGGRGISRHVMTTLASRLRIFVEDRMAVVAEADLQFSQRRLTDAQVDRGWTWSYGLGLEYALDTLLY